MKPALLVIDMQRTFLPQGARTALPNILRLISHFRSSASPGPIIFTQHGYSSSELQPTSSNQLVRKWGPAGSIAKGSPGAELIDEIAQEVRSKEEVLDSKTTYDAFAKTDLEERLRRNGVERVVCCGVLTDACCDATSKSAFNRGFEAWLVGDACGTGDETVHERTLEVWGVMYQYLKNTGEVIKELQ